MEERHILLCNCKGERIRPDLIQSIEDHLRTMTLDITILNDLCGIVRKKPDQLANLFSHYKKYLIIGCHRRLMALLLEQYLLITQEVSFINLLDTVESDVIKQVDDFCCGNIKNGTIIEINEDSGWPSWYPVIDYSRCISCGQCADFCLFSVYEKTDDGIKVMNPEACKNNCPACARICPTTAIIFPKYKNGGAIGGSENVDDAGEQQRQLQDIEALLGDNIYEALQKRKSKRLSIIKEEAMKKAFTEREEALKSISEK